MSVPVAFLMLPMMHVAEGFLAGSGAAREPDMGPLSTCGVRCWRSRATLLSLPAYGGRLAS